MPVLGLCWPFLGQKSIFGGYGVELLVPSYHGTNEAPFSCWKHWTLRFQLAAWYINVLFWIFGAKSQFFCMVIAIFVNRAYYHAVCLGLQLSHSDHQKNCIFKLWVFFWGSPYFLLLSLRNKKYPFFLTFSTKLGGTLRAIKKMTQNYNGPGPGRYYRETAVFTFSRKLFFFGEKCIVSQKNTQNFLWDWFLFGKRQLFSSWPEHA